MFAGDLKGYGQLVAIQHPDRFICATCGDIGDLRMKASDSVDKGQPIALMRPADDFRGAGLRFELRRGAKAIDPRPFMGTPEPPSEDGGQPSAK
jgi:septal ring factor EnvC (AmiA/AmiB activator)